MAIQKAYVPAHVEKRWRIVNFQQPLRVLRLAPVQQAVAERAHLREFGFGVFVRKFIVNGASGHYREVAGFKLSERGAKDSGRRAELAQQFSGQTRAKPGVIDRESQSREDSSSTQPRRYYLVTIRVKV